MSRRPLNRSITVNSLFREWVIQRSLILWELLGGPHILTQQWCSGMPPLLYAPVLHMLLVLVLYTCSQVRSGDLKNVHRSLLNKSTSANLLREGVFLRYWNCEVPLLLVENGKKEWLTSGKSSMKSLIWFLRNSRYIYIRYKFVFDQNPLSFLLNIPKLMNCISSE